MYFDPQMFGGGLGDFLGGIFGHPEKPYDKAMEQYQNWANKSQGVQQPYLNAGTGALGNYQQWLQGQQDPSGFINNLMGDYSQSPYAKNMQQQAMNAGQNYGSATGLSGSTPLMQQMQQNAGNISAADQNQWLQNVLGINTQYGQGQQNLMTGGQNAANKLTDMYGNMGKQMGEQSYNREAAKQNNFWNTMGGGLGMFGSFFKPI